MGMDPIRQTMKDWCDLDFRLEHAKATFNISQCFVSFDQRCRIQVGDIAHQDQFAIDICARFNARLSIV